MPPKRKALEELHPNALRPRKTARLSPEKPPASLLREISPPELSRPRRRMTSTWQRKSTPTTNDDDLDAKYEACLPPVRTGERMKSAGDIKSYFAASKPKKDREAVQEAPKRGNRMLGVQKSSKGCASSKQHPKGAPASSLMALLYDEKENIRFQGKTFGLESDGKAGTKMHFSKSNGAEKPRTPLTERPS